MGISGLAIRRHIGTLVLGLAVLVLGLFVAQALPVDLLPAITYPRIGLRAQLPGVDPQVLVNEVTRPLEEALSTTEGVAQVFSQTREGNVSIDLFFQPGGNLDQALNDATATLNRARASLPADLEPPRLFKIDPSQLPVYELAVTSSQLSPRELRIFAEQELGRQLQQVTGVANTDISGGEVEQVQVNLDLTRLQALGLGLQEVIQALADRNQDYAGGRLRGGNQEPLTRLLGQFQSVAELGDLVLTVPGTNPPQQVLLTDLARVVDGEAEQRLFISLNGRPAVKVSVQKQPEANTVEVVDGIRAQLAAMQASGSWPTDLELTPTLDESRFIRTAIQNVLVAGLSGAGLAALAVFLFLGSLGQTLIIVLAIPLASLVALVLMGWFGLSLNVFSLGGLALGVGIVVDNAIVMLENLTRRLQSLEDPSPPPEQVLAVAQAASQELESALVAATATNLVAVVPFLLFGGFISLIFNPLVLTVSFAVAASLGVALTIVPTLAARLGVGARQSSDFGGLNRALAGLTQAYGRALDRLLRRRGWVIILSVLVLGGGSLALGSQLQQEILPPINTGLARVNVRFPAGTTLAANRRVMAAVDEVVLAKPQVTYAFTTAGGSLFGSNTNENPLRGTSTLTLRPGTDLGAFSEGLEEELRRLPLIDTRLSVSPERLRGLILSNSPVRSDLDLGLQAEDPEVLRQAGRQLLAALADRARLARYRPDADPPQEEVQIQPDWSRVKSLDLTSPALGATLQTALRGTVATYLQRGDRRVPVQVQLAPGTVQQPDQLLDIPLFNRDGDLIKLGDLAQLQLAPAPGEIQRINRRPVFLIAGDLAEGARLGAAIAEAEAILQSLELPDGVTPLPSAAAATNRQLQRSLVSLAALASFAVFVVMALQYNSLIDPLVIMVTIPLALSGAILGLFVTQTGVGAMVIVGAVLLVGIVVNNAILMVELANQIYTASHCSRRQAIRQAAPQRLRPILMTTLTTVLGLFPLALGVGEGGEFLQPLGIVVFSGLSLATLLTLFLVPCLYTLLHERLKP
jgi:multidrug efflux pump subunit AcrB